MKSTIRDGLRRRSPAVYTLELAVVVAAGIVLSACSSGSGSAPAGAPTSQPATPTAAPTRERPTMTEVPAAPPTPPPTAVPSTPRQPPTLSETEPLYFSWIGSAGGHPAWAVASWHDGHVPAASYHLLHSDDGGLTWSEVTPPQSIPTEDLRTTSIQATVGGQDQAWALFVGPQQPTDLLWHTTDAGNTWKAAGFKPRASLWGGAPWMGFHDSGEGWLVDSYFLGAGSTDSDIQRTDDGGGTWETLIRSQGSPVAPILGFDSFDGEFAWAVTGDGPGFIPPYALHITQDGGLTWDEVALGPSTFPLEGAVDCDVRLPALLSPTSGRLVRQCSSRTGPTATYLGITNDGGQSWTYHQVPAPPVFQGETSAWADGPAVSGGTPTGSLDSVFHSEDGGRTWQAIGQIPPVESFGFSSLERGWAIRDGSLLASYDGGRTWSPQEAHLTAPAAATDLTNWVAIPADLPLLTRANVAEVGLLAEFQAPRATSLGADGQSIYAGTQDGELIVLPWRQDRAIGDGLPRLHVGSGWLYEVVAPANGLGFVAAGRDGRAYASDEYLIPTMNTMAPGAGEISGVARAGEGVLTGGADGVIRFWLPPTDPGPNLAPQWTLEADQGWVWDVASSVDGDTFASSGADGTVKLWLLTNRSLVATLRGHQSAVTRLGFSPDGSALASASRDGTVRVWDTANGQFRFVLEASADWITDVGYSPSGNLLATVAGDGMLTVWDPTSGDRAGGWEAHPGAALGVVFSPDAKMLVTVGDDGLMRLWGGQR